FGIMALLALPAEPLKLFQNNDKPKPDIAFEKETHDFGIIAQGKPVSFTFIFKNTGNAPLTVRHAQASCGCTKPEWTQTPVEPGKKGFVKVTYNAAEAGEFNKFITLICNSATKPTLKIF